MVFGITILKRRCGKVIVANKTSGGGVLSFEDVEKAAAKALAKSAWTRRTNLVYTEINSEFKGTPWASGFCWTKNQRVVAGLHTTLQRLGMFEKFSQKDLEDIHTLSIKRLRCAQWAKHQQKKA